MLRNYEISLHREVPDNFLSVERYGYQKCKPGHSFGPGKKGHYIIHYVLKGRGSFSLGKLTYHLGPGDGFLIRPDELAYYAADTEDPWEYCWVIFNGLNVNRLLRLSDLSTKNVFSTKKGDTLGHYMNLLCRNEEQPTVPEFEAIGYLYLIFSSLISNADVVKEANSKDYIKQIMEYMQQNYSKPLTVEGIASHFGLSRSQLFRTFKQHLQVSPVHYLLDIRFSRARLLLQQTNMNISEICTGTGFRDISHFNRMFRKRHSMTPSEYRAQQRDWIKQHPEGTTLITYFDGL